MEIEMLEDLENLEEAEYLDQEMEDGSANVCRVCLISNPSLLISISVKHKTCKNIAGLIKYVSNVQIRENDSFPQFICKECLDSLEAAHKIKAKCVDSDKQMRSQIIKIQLKEEEEEIIYDDANYELIGSDEEYKPPPALKRSLAMASNSNISSANIVEEFEIVEAKVESTEILSISPLPQYMMMKKRGRQLGTKSENRKEDLNCENCGKHLTSSIGLKRHYTECPKTYQLCEICNEKIQGRALFLAHIERHVKEDAPPLMECPSCEQKMYHREAIMKHRCPGFLEMSKQPVRNTCYLCNEEFEVQKLLFTHITKAHRRDGMFYCPISACEAKTVYTPKTFHFHLESHFENLNIVCKICGEIFTDRYLHYLHEMEHKKGSVYKCDFCGKEIMNKESLLKHIQMLHVSVPHYPCDKCGCSFRTEPQLQKHQIKEHGATGNFQCEICGTWFLQQASMRYHMKSHLEREMVGCELCQQQFKHNLDLKRHVELAHLRKTNYQCDVCQKYFMRGYDLTCHKRLHTGDKRHGCTICEMRFYTKSALVTHIRVHTGETPYTCYLCDKKYKDHRGVRSHLKKFHKIANPNTKNLFNKTPQSTIVEIADDNIEIVEVSNYIEIKNEK